MGPLDPPERTLQCLCQRRLDRCGLSQICRCPLPSGVVRWRQWRADRRAGRAWQQSGQLDISGQPLPGVSRWALSWGGEGNLPIHLFGKAGQLYLGYDGSARTRFSSNPTPSAYTWVDGYTLSNFRTGFRTAAGLDVSVWVRNAFAANYFEQLQVPSGNTGLIVGSPGDPRTWGLTARIQF